MDESSVFRIIAGLGNPGAEYANTRHNVGFLVVDELASRLKLNFQFDKQWDADTAKSGDLWLLKPKTFMNLSGESVSLLARYYKILPSQVLIVTDDASLPLGHLRLRKDGSPGGHRGVESILMHLGTSVIPRLRVGIGSATGEMQDHVLGKFLDDEAPLVNDAVKRAADAIQHALTNDLDATMNLFNQNTTANTL
ncbi:MAG: aminoacyl-tRNA hydrolase [Chthoniobacterales bacterium]